MSGEHIKRNLGLIAIIIFSSIKVAIMTVVAVAGGTQGLGRSIVDQLVKHSEYEVLIFSRKVSGLFRTHPTALWLIVVAATTSRGGYRPTCYCGEL